MRVYIAAPWVDRAHMADIAEQFEAAGHTITEKWWLHRDVPWEPEVDSTELERQSMRDFEGVTNADTLVVINSGMSEGKAVEQGIALTMCIPVVLVGSRSNIFHYMPSVQRAGTVAEAIEELHDHWRGRRRAA